MEEHIKAAKEELGKLIPTGKDQKKIVQCTPEHLDEGTIAKALHQKHIRITDQSDLAGVVVEAYMDDELASKSDNERELYKAGQEVQQAVKRKWAESVSAAAAAKRTWKVSIFRGTYAEQV